MSCDSKSALVCAVARASGGVTRVASKSAFVLGAAVLGASGAYWGAKAGKAAGAAVGREIAGSAGAAVGGFGGEVVGIYKGAKVGVTSTRKVRDGLGRLKGRLRGSQGGFEASYRSGKFNKNEAQQLTDQFGGTSIRTESVLLATGPGSKIGIHKNGAPPALLSSGGFGDVFFTPTETPGKSTIWLCIPRRGYKEKMANTLQQLAE